MKEQSVVFRQLLDERASHQQAGLSQRQCSRLMLYRMFTRYCKLLPPFFDKVILVAVNLMKMVTDSNVEFAHQQMHFY